MTACIKHFEHDVSAFELTDMRTLHDVVTYFETPVRVTSPLEEMSKVKLPPNLNIQMEPIRYDKDRDNLFGGVSALTGMDSHVMSIKYGRKFKSIINNKPRAGYANFYWENWKP